MLFEEFFKKKKIDLAALQVAEGSLFSEFKDHFEQMGEKSFDHTKKYWFNKLRRRFPLAPEIKTERLHIANPLAEQTITDGLTTPATPSPKVGFTPKFGATTVPPKPVEETTPADASIPSENIAPKPAFKPRFNPGMVKPKAVEGADAIEQKTDVAGGAATPPADTPAAKPPGFKPRFNAAMVKVKPKPAEENDVPADKPEVKEQPPAPAAETPVAKPGFKPRFNAAMVKPKPAEESDAPADEPEVKEQPPVPAAETPVAKPGFKPRFNAAMMKPKPVVKEDVTPAPEVKTEPLAPSPPEAESAGPATETPAAKLVYKPKFNMKNLPKKPDQE